MIKFRNFSIDELRFVKYADWCNEYFKGCHHEIKLLPMVRNASKLYSEESEEQGYVIGLNDVGMDIIGLARIGTSASEEDLEVALEFTEGDTDTRRYWVQKIIHSLEALNYDKKKIYVSIYNRDVKLNNVFFKRCQSSPRTLDYVKSNDSYPVMMRIINEMQSYEEALTQTGRYWVEYASLRPNYRDDMTLNQALLKHDIPSDDIFTYADKVAWKDIKGSGKYTDHIGFKADGTVVYRRCLRSLKEPTAYTTFSLKYNVASSCFGLKAFSSNKNGKTRFTTNSDVRNGYILADTYVDDNLHIASKKIGSNDAMRTFTSVSTGVDTKTSIALAFKENGTFDYCYVDFDSYSNRRHQNKRLVNGTYMLRIRRWGRNAIKANFYFTKRDGKHESLFTNPDAEIPFDDLTSLPLLQRMIDEVLAIVNRRESAKGYNYTRPMSLRKMLKVANRVDEVTTSIQTNIAGPYIKDSMDEQQIVADSIKEKILKV